MYRIGDCSRLPTSSEKSSRLARLEPPGVVDLPGERLLVEQLLARIFDQVAAVVVLVVPVLVGAVGELADQDRRAALGQKQQREAGGDDRRQCVAVARAGPRAIFLLLSDDELAAFAIPVVPGEEALAREPAGPLDAVSVVKEIARSRKLKARAAVPPARRAIRAPSRSLRSRRRCRTADRLPSDANLPPARVQFQAGDVQAAQAGDGHRQRRATIAVVERIDPAAVGVLAALVELLDRLPD